MSTELVNLLSAFVRYIIFTLLSDDLSTSGQADTRHLDLQYNQTAYNMTSNYHRKPASVSLYKSHISSVYCTQWVTLSFAKTNTLIWMAKNQF